MPKSPSERTQVIPRRTIDTSNIEGQGLQALSNSLGQMNQFFGGLMAQAQEREMEEDKRIVKQELARIRAGMTANPEEAIRANKTGNYTAFSQYEVATHKILGPAAAGYAGAIMASQDTTDFDNALGALPETASGQGFFQDYLKDKTKGMDPFAAEAYVEAMQSHADKRINARRTAINKANYDKIKERAPGLFNAGLLSGALNSYEDFEKAVAAQAQVATAYGIPLAKGLTEIGEAGRQEVMIAAQDNSNPKQGVALAIMESQKWSTLYPDEVAAASAKVDTRQSVLTAEGRETILDLETAMAADPKGINIDKIGAAYEAALAAQRATSFDGKPRNKTFLAAQEKYFKLLEANAIETQVLKAYAAREPVTPAHRDKIQKSLLERAGKDPKAMQALILTMKEGGASDATKSWLAGKLRDPKHVAEGVQMLTGLNAGDFDTADYLPAGEVQYAEGLLLLARSGVQGQGLADAVESIRENLKLLDITDPSRAYEALSTRATSSGRAAFGRKDVNTAVNQMWSKIKSALGASDGDRTYEMDAKFRNALGIATLMTMNTTDDPNVIINTAIQLVGKPDNYEYGMIDGKPVLVERHSPRAMVQGGQKVKNDPFSPDTASAAYKHAQDTGLGDFIPKGSKWGVMPDEATSRDGRMGVYYTDALNRRRPLAFIPGIHKLDPELTKSPLMKHLIERAEGLEFPDGSKGAVKQFSLGSGYHALWTGTQWEVRVDPAGAALSNYERKLTQEASTMRSPEDLMTMRGWEDFVPKLTPEERVKAVRKKRADLLADVRAEETKQPLFQFKDEAGTLEIRAGNQARDTALDMGKKSGNLGSLAVGRVKNDPDYEKMSPQEAYNKALELTDQLGEPEALGADFQSKAARFIGHLESNGKPELAAYPDKFMKNGKWVMAKSVGFGFNLERPDAEAALAAVNAPTKAQLMKGEATITTEQAYALKEYAIEKYTTWLRNHFAGVSGLTPNRWIALTSLAYNSKWSDKGPTLIGPNLTKYIRAGNWKAAEDEIRYRSAGVDNPEHKRGIIIRRNKEADLFAGRFDLDQLK